MEQIINAVGRRKAAVARVFLRVGSGKITVNKRNMEEYFSLPYHQDAIKLPLQLTDSVEKFDIQVNVSGGGVKGQAEAVRLGIARALVASDEELKPLLKAKDLMTRDPRKVERKKPGLRKARKKTQFSKR